MYIYVYVCIHIYTAVQREHFILGFQGDECPHPIHLLHPQYINVPMMDFYNQGALNLEVILKLIFFLVLFDTLKLPHTKKKQIQLRPLP